MHRSTISYLSHVEAADAGSVHSLVLFVHWVLFLLHFLLRRCLEIFFLCVSVQSEHCLPVSPLLWVPVSSLVFFSVRLALSDSSVTFPSDLWKEGSPLF